MYQKIFIEDLSVLGTVEDTKMETTQTLSKNLFCKWKSQTKRQRSNAKSNSRQKDIPKQ